MKICNSEAAQAWKLWDGNAKSLVKFGFEPMDLEVVIM